jgi:hypothetical protein
VARAVLEVLVWLPPPDFAAFISRHPFFLCVDGPDGAALRIPPDSGEVIYLHPRVFRWPPERISTLVAHEVAHVILKAQATLDAGDANKLADDLAESWGYHRSYSPRALKRLREWLELRDRQGDGPAPAADRGDTP